MKLVHCDGCNATESADLTKPTIKTVILHVEKDSRFPEGIDKHHADLCEECQHKLLEKFFRGPRNLEVPEFLAPLHSIRIASDR